MKELIRSFYKSKEYQAISPAHQESLISLRDSGFYPKTIYDIGSCVGAWYKAAKKIWPDAQIILFDGWKSVEFLYKELGVEYHIGLLGEKSKEVEFYYNDRKPGGNSYYKPNEKYVGSKYEQKEKLDVETLDDVIIKKGFNLPSFIKLDVQGAELDILSGGKNTIANVEYILLEAQNVDFNIKAPKEDEVIEYLNNIGFEKMKDLGFTSKLKVDKDLLFCKKK
jgi:FkbM family methyltransferase